MRQPREKRRKGLLQPHIPRLVDKLQAGFEFQGGDAPSAVMRVGQRRVDGHEGADRFLSVEGRGNRRSVEVEPGEQLTGGLHPTVQSPWPPGAPARET